MSRWLWLFAGLVVFFLPGWVAVGALVYMLYLKGLVARYRHHKQQKAFRRRLKDVVTTEDILDR